MGSDTKAEIKLNFAHRLGRVDKRRMRNKERDILLGYPDGSTKLLVLDSLWEKPTIVVEGQELTFSSDICPLTLQRRKDWKFLTTKLIDLGIPYKCSFLFKLLIKANNSFKISHSPNGLLWSLRNASVKSLCSGGSTPIGKEVICCL